MPSRAQLEAEPWWDREIVTTELDWLGDELCRRTGRPRAAAGTKGDVAHLRGSHRSQEWIRNSAFCTDRGYTVQGGLTADQLRHIAGFDFTPGSGQQMVAMCRRVMAELKAGRLEAVREFYGNVDGDQVVDGWDNLNNRAATSDGSHLWHFHASFDRRYLTDRALMERFVRIVMGDPEPEEAPVSLTPTQDSWVYNDSSITGHAWQGHDTAPVKDAAGKTGVMQLGLVATIKETHQRVGELLERDPEPIQVVLSDEQLSALADLVTDRVVARLSALHFVATP